MATTRAIPVRGAYNSAVVLLHAVTAALRYFLLILLFRDLAHRRLLAAAATLVATMHGATAESVVGIVGAAEILAGAFMTLSWLAFAGALEATSTRLRVAWAFGAGLAYFASLLSKETGVFFPLVLAAYAVTTWSRPSAAAGRRPLVALLWTAAFAAIGAAMFLVLRKNALGSVVNFGLAGVFDDFTTIERLSTALRAVVLVYARGIVYPFGLSPNLTHQELPPEASLADPVVILGITLLLVLLSGALWLCARRNRSGPLLLWAFLAYLPTSNLIVPIGAIAAYRFLFTPLFALVAALAAAAARTSERRPPAMTAAVGLVVLGVLGFVGSRKLISQWSTPAALYAETLAMSPESAWALQNDTWVNHVGIEGANHQTRLAALRRVDRLLPGLHVVPSTGRVDRQSAASVWQMLMDRALFIGMTFAELGGDQGALKAEAERALREAERFAIDTPETRLDGLCRKAHIYLSFWRAQAARTELSAEERVGSIDAAIDALDQAKRYLPKTLDKGLRLKWYLLRHQALLERRGAAKLLPGAEILKEDIDRLLVDALAIDPDDADLRFTLAEGAATAGRFDLALGHLEHVIAKGKGSVRVFTMAAVYAERQGLAAKEMEFIRRASSLPARTPEEAKMREAAVQRLRRS